MIKNMKPGRRYIIINIDEPYAEDVYEILKAGQMKKGEWPEGDIPFKTWVAQTFGPGKCKTPGCNNYTEIEGLSCRECFRKEVTAKKAAKEEYCHANNDGECTWKHCPQLRDGEPKKTGRHCPLDKGGGEE